VAQAEMSPSLACVSGFVYAVADGEIGAMQTLSAGDINDVGIGRGNGNGADRLRGLVFENGTPGPAVVVRLPNPTVYLANVENVGLAGDSSSGAGAAASKWAHHAPVQVLVGAFRSLRPSGGRG